MVGVTFPAWFFIVLSVFLTAQAVEAAFEIYFRWKLDKLQKRKGQ